LSDTRHAGPRPWKRDLNPRKSLDNNDGHGFFQALGDSVVTGPTLTNVNDFRAIVIDGPSTASTGALNETSLQCQDRRHARTRERRPRHG